MYFRCCGREVEPGGTFYAPWLSAKHDRAVRAAMRDGVLAWEPGKGEPDVPGSPVVPSERERAEARKRAEDEAEKRRAEEERAMQERMKRDNEAVSRNMANMGNFDMPKPIPRRAPTRAVAADRPVTGADIIQDDRPRSLAAIVRHNRAIKVVERAKSAGNTGDAGNTGKSTTQTSKSKSQTKED
jgi:hypothetical protein